MKKQLTLLACLAYIVLSAAPALAQTEAPAAAPPKQAELSTWKTYHVKGEEISASLPTHPAVTINRRYRELLRQTLTDRMVGVYADGVVYAIYTYDNPEPRDSFDDFVAQQRGVSEDIAPGRHIKLGSMTGKEYSSGTANFSRTTQFFAAQDRFYEFTATGAPADDPAVKQFFSSITVGKKNGIEVSDGAGTPFLKPAVEGPNDFLTGRQVDTKARLVMKPEPSYTDSAREAQIVGTVVLKVVFSSAGAVTNIQTVQALPHGLTEAAISAARKIKYIPAIKDGKYVSMWMQLEYNFNLY